MAGRTNDPGDSVLARANRMLLAFTDDDPELDLPKLAARSGLARSTAHRLATQLVGLGLLDRTPTGYIVGTRLWEIGELSPVSWRLRETALPHLLALHKETGENVHLAMLAGTEVLYVSRLTGQLSVPVLSRMGGRLPLHTTGVGKAILATRDDDWLAAYFLEPHEKETTYSVTDEEGIRAEIVRGRAMGYSVTRQEMTLGNASIAAAVPAVPGLPPSAVGVVSHLGRGDEARIAPLVMAAAAEIGRELARTTR